MSPASILTSFIVIICLVVGKSSAQNRNCNITYYFVSREDLEELTLVDSGAELDSAQYMAQDARLNVLLHGLGGSFNNSFNQLITKALQDIGEENILIVDYRQLVRATDYLKAVRMTSHIGRDLAEFLSDVTVPLRLIGFSLGAQVAAVASFILRTEYNQTVDVIYGLDPANPRFQDLDRSQKLDPSDAEFVVVIHTAAGAMGGLEPIGHVDFYPNGGLEPQPQCAMPSRKFGPTALMQIFCSHSSAYQYLAESVHGGYTATRCSSWADYLASKCDGSPKLSMNFQIPTNSRGSYYLKTRAESPFSLPEDIIQENTIHMKSSEYASSDSERESDTASVITRFIIIGGQIISMYHMISRTIIYNMSVMY